MKERLQSIQVLRAVAACLVVGFHFIGIAAKFFPGDEIGGPVIALFRYGWIGIDLFFVVSGFIIALTTEHASGLRDAASYLRRRIIRIVPIYWVLTLAMATVALSSTLLSGDVAISPAWLALSLTFWPPKAWGYDSPILFVGWTLSYEMLFYVIVFVAVALRSRMAIAAGIFALVWAGIFFDQAAAGSFSWMTHSITIEFLMGYAVFWIYRRAALGTLWAAACVIAGLAAIATAAMSVPDNTIWRSLANGVAVSGFILGVVNIERNSVVLVPAWLGAMGDASYSIYLMQCFTLPLALYFFPASGLTSLGPTAICLAGVVLTALSGGAVYRLAEKPLMSVAKRAFGFLSSRRAATS
jgi:peptidoglycan/LPS O-acetylase OafA/YrhL